MTALFIPLLIIAAGCQGKLHKETRVLMGTFVEVISSDKAAPKIAFDEIKRIEHLLSKYDPKSEISILNSTGAVKASPETLYVMKKSAEFWKLSDGKLDPTVGPLLDLWGFTDKNFRIPAPEEINRALEAVGMAGYEKRASHHLSLGEKRRIAIATVLAMSPTLLVLDEPTTNLDPGGKWHLIELLRGLPVTKLIVSHDLDIVRALCSRVVIMDKGCIIADGEKESILNDHALLAAHSLAAPEEEV